MKHNILQIFQYLVQTSDEPTTRENVQDNLKIYSRKYVQKKKKCSKYQYNMKICK